MSLDEVAMGTRVNLCFELVMHYMQMQIFINCMGVMVAAFGRHYFGNL